MRILVLDLLQKKDAATSLTDLERDLYPADRTTIYRTLKIFEEKGLIHIIEDGTGTPKYALCLNECEADDHHDLHVHFYCANCKETFCLPDTEIPHLNLPYGFFAAEMNLVVKGVCNKCNQAID